jgi:hypothetical protein
LNPFIQRNAPILPAFFNEFYARSARAVGNLVIVASALYFPELLPAPGAYDLHGFTDYHQSSRCQALVTE